MEGALSKFFYRTDGVGWQFELWEGDDGWMRFKKAVMCAVLCYAKAYAKNKGVPLDGMMQAHLLEVRCAFGIVIISVVSAFALTPPSPPRVKTQMPPRCVKTALAKQPRLLVHANSTWRLRSRA
jgi:hypothetical protein